MLGYGVVFKSEWMDIFNDLDDSRRGKLFKALLDLGFHGEVTDFDDKELAVAYKIIGNEILRDVDKYKKRCEINRKNAQNRRKRNDD